MTELNAEQIDAISRTVEKWDTNKSIKRASEEMLELALSLLHFDRKKADIDEVLNEMADVHIALKHLQIKFGDYQKQLDAKVIKGNS